MDREHAARPKGPPPGEYVVRHERPYPERLDRAFRIGALATAGLAGFTLAGVVALHLPMKRSRAAPFACSGAFVLAGALTWGCASALGMALIGIVTLSRRKAYVGVWDEPENVEQQARQTWMFFGVLALLCALIQAVRVWL